MPTKTTPLNALDTLENEDVSLLEFLSFVFDPAPRAILISEYNTYARSKGQTGLSGFAPLKRLIDLGLVTVAEDENIACRRDMVEELSLHAAQAGRADAICQYLNSRHYIFRGATSLTLPWARRLLYQGRVDGFTHLQNYSRHQDLELNEDYSLQLLKGMATTAPLEFFPEEFSFQLACQGLQWGLLQAKSPGVALPFLAEIQGRPSTPGINPSLFAYYLACDNRQAASQLLRDYPIPDLFWCLQVAMGDLPSPGPEPMNTDIVARHPLLGFLLSLACLKADKLDCFDSCLAATGYESKRLSHTLQLIDSGESDDALEFLLLQLQHRQHTRLFDCLAACCLYWAGRSDDLKVLPLQEWARDYRHSGFTFLADLLDDLDRVKDGDKASVPFLRHFTPPQRWERFLTHLGRVGPSPDASPPEPEQRIVWELNLSLVHPIRVKVQKWGKKGDWTSGRKIDLGDLGKYYPEGMDQHDRKVFEAIILSQYRGSSEMGEALLALAGHPRLFDKQSRPIRLKVAQPDLSLQSDEETFELQTSWKLKHGIAFRKLGPTHYEIAEPDDELYRLLATLEKHTGVRVPLEHLGTVTTQLLESRSTQLRIASDLPLTTGEIKPGETDLVVRLTPEGSGLSAVVSIDPTGGRTPLYPPGRGDIFLNLARDGRRVTFQRDLKAERKRFKALTKQVPLLQKPDQVLEHPSQCLELLESLSEAEVRVEWPEGQTFRLKHKAGWNHFGLSVKRKKDWLEVRGELRLSETERLDMAQLMNLHQQQRSRFIELADGQFLALSEEFHRRLDALERAAKKQTSQGVELDTLSGSVLLEDSEMVEADEFWNELQERMARARDFVPKIPKKLKADLRPYQEEGFRWLARSAERGVGCCLADDMGLGKTLQALALVASRSRKGQGPTLVVAPTSVCFNWDQEIRRFTPTLVPHLFSDKRETALEELDHKDVVITSYGLLVREIEKFRQLTWGNVILDEAQAIKNPTTKRFKAAVALQADFRLATTGTPIENRVDEIWAIFRFLNPGLLGSRKAFDKAYSGLEEQQDKRESLRRLIAPFILRRLKSKVLSDLPPRTDVNLTVELPRAEMLHYESLRRHALERLESATQRDAINILSELTRLRQACCHPRLVDPDSSLEGAKLKVLKRLLGDLKDSDHRALIFSQFVGHLKIVEEELKKLGWSYLYLDGSTPAGKRKKLVQSFQNGKADFFLISLKAGGTGLNLTAANYVVHLDPWWNPAVEDQASDRAHRIGQDQPVTVYRLVTKGTIEESILELHREKRELADELLSGTDKAAGLSAEELLNLIRSSVS